MPNDPLADPGRIEDLRARLRDAQEIVDRCKEELMELGEPPVVSAEEAAAYWERLENTCSEDLDAQVRAAGGDPAKLEAAGAKTLVERLTKADQRPGPHTMSREYYAENFWKLEITAPGLWRALQHIRSKQAQNLNESASYILGELRSGIESELAEGPLTEECSCVDYFGAPKEVCPYCRGKGRRATPVVDR